MVIVLISRFSSLIISIVSLICCVSMIKLLLYSEREPARLETGV